MNRTYLLLTALLTVPFSAQATVSKTWTFSGTSAPGNGLSSMTAYATQAITGGGATFQTTGVSFGYYSGGLGVGSPSDYISGSLKTPDHAFDNNGAAGNTNLYDCMGGGGSSGSPDCSPNGAVDAAVFKFDTNTTLTGVNIGYKSGDADISVLAYTGTNAATEANDLTNKTFAWLLSHSWTFVGNYADLAAGTTSAYTKAINGLKAGAPASAAPVSSSYWLISAYTSSAGNTVGNNGNGNGNTTGLDFGNDYFKIHSLTGTPGNPGVQQSGSAPEPTSLLLLVSGMLGWRMSRRNVEETSNSMAAIQA